MDRQTVTSLKDSPEFKDLLRARRTLAAPFLFLILAAYFGFILMVAFAPATLGTTFGGGMTSLGIYMGLGLLLLCFVINGIYLRRAERRIDPLLRAIRAKTEK